VQEGDGWATSAPCGLAIGLHDKALRQDENKVKSTKYSTSPQDFTSSPLEAEPSAKTPEA
jgi:hypothetical protein